MSWSTPPHLRIADPTYLNLGNIEDGSDPTCLSSCASLGVCKVLNFNTFCLRPPFPSASFWVVFRRIGTYYSSNAVFFSRITPFNWSFHHVSQLVTRPPLVPLRTRLPVAMSWIPSSLSSIAASHTDSPLPPRNRIVSVHTFFYEVTL